MKKHAKNRFFQTAACLAVAVALALSVLTLPVIFAAAEDTGSVLLINDSFLNGLSDNWEEQTAFGTADEDGVRTSSLLLNTYKDSYMTNTLLGTTSAGVLYSRPLQSTGSYEIRFDVALRRGVLLVPFGCQNNLDAALYGTGLSISRSKISGNGTLEANFPVDGAEVTLPETVTVCIELTPVAIDITVYDGAQTYFALSNTSGCSTGLSAPLAGYFGFFGIGSTEWASYMSANIFYCHIVGGINDYDAFTDASTVRFPDSAAEPDYKWLALSGWDSYQADYLKLLIRVVSGNELLIDDVSGSKQAGSPADMGYILRDGGEPKALSNEVGATYTATFDLSLCHWDYSQFFAVFLQGSGDYLSYTTVPGMANYPNYRIGTGRAGIGLGSTGDARVHFIYGDESEISKLAPVNNQSVWFSNILHVTLTFTQTEANIVTAALSYTTDLNARDPGVKQTQTFQLTGKIAKQLGFRFNGPSMFSNFRFYDGETVVTDSFIGAADTVYNAFGTSTATAVDSGFSWYMNKGVTGSEAVDYTLYCYNGSRTAGLYIDGKMPEGAALISKAQVPFCSPQVSGDTQMFEAAMTVQNETIVEGGYGILFGVDQTHFSADNPSRVELTAGGIAVYGGQSAGGVKSAAFVRPAAFTLILRAFINGRLDVYAGSAAPENLILSETFADSDSFSGAVGLIHTLGAASGVVIGGFSLRSLPGPNVELKNPRFVYINDGTDLTAPLVLDGNLSTYFVEVNLYAGTDAEGTPLATVDAAPYTYDFAAAGYYTLAYKIADSFGAFSEAQMTVRAVHKGDESAKIDALKNNFMSGLGNGWTATGSVSASGGTAAMGESSTLKTVGTMPAFILDFTVDACSGGSFEITFGESYDYAHAFGIVFNAAEPDRLTLRNLSENTVLFTDAGFNFFDAGFAGAHYRLYLTSAGGMLSVRAADRPHDDLGKALAVFTFQSDMPMQYGKIGFVTGGGATASLSKVRLVTLDAAVHIDTENFIEQEPPVISEAPEGGLQGWQIALIVVGSVIAAGGAGVLAVMLIRRKRAGKA